MKAFAEVGAFSREADAIRPPPYSQSGRDKRTKRDEERRDKSRVSPNKDRLGTSQESSAITEKTGKLIAFGTEIKMHRSGTNLSVIQA